MSEIKQQVSLLKAQSIGIGMSPLLKHFIAYAPHDYGRMVAIAAYDISEVTLMPLVEIARIVTFGLFLAPHIESLVHNHKPHAVTEVKKFRSRRIMRTSYGVDTHLLHYFKLSLYSPAVHYRA